MQNIFESVKEALSGDSSLIIEGQLNRAKVEDLALRLDSGLLNLLLQDEEVKNHFFTNVEGTLVFDKIKFQQFINNKSFLPDSYTAYKNKIGLTTDGEFLSEGREVVLAWPYKDCVLEGGQTQEDQARDEVFWNETLAPDEIDRLFEPKVLTGFKRFDIDGEHEVNEIGKSDNLIFKGNNLLALHSLRKLLAGQVKLIYIDPPYNTGNDSFGYNDTFNHSSWLTFMKNRLEVAREVLRSNGVIFIQCDDNEQAYLKVLMDSIFGDENYINTIAVNMKNIAGASGGGEDKRLKKNIEYLHVYAKNYSSFDSFHHVYNYIPINELVEQYRKNGVSWKYTTVLVNEGDKEYIGSTLDGSGDEIKIFSRSNAIIKSMNQVMKDDGLSENEAYEKYADKIFQTEMPQSSIRPRVMERVKELNIDGDLFSIEYVPKSGRYKGDVHERFYKGKNFRLLAWLSDVSEEIDGELFKKELQGTFWDFVGETKNLAKEGNVELPSGKKPEKLLQRIIEMSTEQNDLILDYHLGSGTTAAVAHKMGRQYIGVEQLDYGENDSMVRLKNVIEGDQSGISKSVNWEGGGSFVYCELMQWNEQFVEKIKAAKKKNKLFTIWDEMKAEGFLSYKVQVESFNPEAKDFQELSFKEQQRFLFEVLDKNMLYVNLSDMEDEDYSVSDKDKRLTEGFYELGN